MDPLRKTDKNVHPEDGASLFSKLMVNWMNPLITLSGKRQLSYNDVWETPSAQSVKHDADIVWSSWLDELQLAAAESRDPSLIQALFTGFWKEFLVAGGLQAVFMLSQISQPYLVGELVQYVQHGNGGLSYGAGISVALLVVSLISSMSFTAGFFILRRLGVSVRSGVMMAVYEKALRLTSASRMQNTIGQTTNLMSIDSEKLFLSAQFLHFVWHGPIANIIVMLLIIQDVGVGPGLLGLASQLALLPLQNYLAGSIGRVRRTMVNHTDERVKLMNEILQAIRVIKVYAWEVPMEERVMKVRARELSCLKIYLTLSSALRELLFIAGPIASIVVFSSLIYGFGQSITLVEMFRVTAFINILRLPSSLLGQALKNLSDAKVSAARLTRFFLLPTLPATSRGDVENPRIEIKEANFKWDVAVHQGKSENNERNFVDTILSKMSFKQGTSSKDAGVNAEQSSKEVETLDRDATGDTLKNISIVSSDPGELIAVIGSVGSGKSSLISALLQEIPLVGGSCTVEGKVAYCAQTPWIQNLSLRDNVLFGEDYADPAIHAAYERAIDAAALRPDLAILSEGDLTEIGERGINLSGGQKSRVSIARAILAARNAQVVLLDDPFSAVDGATGNWIFEHGILGLLRGRLRVVALNSHRHLLSRFDRVIVLEGGRVVADVRPADLPIDMLQGGVEGDVIPLQEDELHDDVSTLPQNYAEAAATTLPSIAASTSGAAGDDGDFHLVESTKQITVDTAAVTSEALPCEKLGEISSAEKFTDAEHSSDGSNADAVDLSGQPEHKKLIVAESRRVGDVSMVVYNRYFAAAFEGSSTNSSMFDDDAHGSSAKKGSPTCLSTAQSVSSVAVLVFLFAATQFVRVAVDYSLARWAEFGGSSHGSKQNNDWSTAYYIAFAFLFVFLAARSSLLNVFALFSASHIHRDLFRSVLCAPVTTFFDTHTMGEILNRFSKDTEIVDSSVPEFVMQALVNWMQVFSVFALSLYATPYFAAVIVPLIFLFYRIYVKFGSAQRDLKRLEAVSRSPVYASLSETLSGLETIRAYGATDRFLHTHLLRMDFNQKFFFHLWMCTSWLTARLEISTSLILFSISILCVSLRAQISPVALGLALTYGLQLNALFQRVVQITIDIMSYMISTERVLEYCDIIPEPSTVLVIPEIEIDITLKNTGTEYFEYQTDASKNTIQHNPGLPASHSASSPDAKSELDRDDAQHLTCFNNTWPSQGIVRFDDVWMRYRDNAAVLRGISFSTLPAMRIGICGRTGAGKSSLMVALLRMAPLMSGAVYLDEVNIATVPLQTLRSVIAIIPQDPVLFTGTLRFQLDPFFQYSDIAVWDALHQVNMSEFVQSVPEGLAFEIFEGGENLSQGQRQLLCIARALLRNARVLIMDEGTSAVDPKTDELIQKVLRDGASKNGTTVLTIAHRLETILDFDRILVLGAGAVLEFDSPSNLLADKSSIFSSMVAEQDGGHS